MPSIQIAIPADHPQFKTGIDYDKGERISITYVRGEWYFNPVHGWVKGTSGIDNVSAPKNYRLPEAPEGRLCARIGESPWFDAHNLDKTLPLQGTLFLACNDELTPQDRNKGYADNEGAIVVRVTLR